MGGIIMKKVVLIGLILVVILVAGCGEKNIFLLTTKKNLKY